MGDTVRVYIEDENGYVNYDKDDLAEIALERWEYSDPKEVSRLIDKKVDGNRFSSEDKLLVDVGVAIGAQATPEDIRREMNRERIRRAQR